MRRLLAKLARQARDEHEDLTRESAQEEIASAIAHVIGTGLAVAALVLGVVYAAEIENAWAIVASAIYGTTLVWMFVASALYHGISKPRAKLMFMALDHCAIFLLIAGTYTAITITLMHGLWQGWLLFGIVWALAVAGMLLRLIWLRYMHPVFYPIYLAMGLAGVAFADVVGGKVGWNGVVLLIAGCACYTGGLALYAMRRLRFNHALWHVAVMAGAAFHFVAVYDHVIPRAP